MVPAEQRQAEMHRKIVMSEDAGTSGAFELAAAASFVSASFFDTSSKFSVSSGTSSSSSAAAAVASFFSWFKPSGPSWEMMLGSISVIIFVSLWPVMANVLVPSDACVFGLLKWITEPSFLIMFTSSMPGIVLTPSFFSDSCSFLSSTAELVWTIFFLRRGMPLPPMRTSLCIFFSFSGFILLRSHLLARRFYTAIG
uniref:Uncharacterized protein n=1 Tax=Anopheles coluzzii TaxID=1518534 RepID=A0A8W7PXJ9_ANOCL